MLRQERDGECRCVSVVVVEFLVRRDWPRQREGERGEVVTFLGFVTVLGV